MSRRPHRWDDRPPTDLDELGRSLGIGRKQIMRARAENDEDELREKWSEKWRRIHIERPRFMASQAGQYHPAQYVESVHGAIDDAETVPEHYQRQLDAEARRRDEILNAEKNAKREDRSLVNSLREQRIRARNRGVDVTPETEKVREALEDMRRKLGEAA